MASNPQAHEVRAGARQGISSNLVFISVIGLIALVLIMQPVKMTVQYAMIGYDACSRQGNAPMLIECVPGISDPDTWDEDCSHREGALAIAELKEWQQLDKDCEVKGWFHRADSTEPPAEEPTDPEGNVIARAG
ncbi:MAG: hypothetical protein AAGA08_16935 [Pseudomonadota bacterium]